MSSPQTSPNLESLGFSPPSLDYGVAREHRRSLRSKLVLGVAAILFALFILREVAHKRIIRVEFAALEQQEAVRDAHRVHAAIRHDLQHLHELALQAADRGDLETGEPELPASPLGSAVASVGSADWALLCDPTGSARWIRLPEKPNVSHDDLQRLSSSFQKLATRFRQLPPSEWSGITSSFRGQLSLFAAAPIPVDTNGAGARILILGRLFDQQYSQALREQTQVSFTVDRKQNPEASDRDRSRVEAVWSEDGTMAHLLTPLLGFDSKPLARLRVEIPREISSQARDSNALVRNYFLFGSVAALVALLGLLQRIVIAPVAAIREHTERIAEQGLGAERLVLPINDEIGDLAKAFDRMTERLSEAQQNLRASSRAAGARQVAETVIHNIGNVLTNVNSLLDSANTQVAGLRVQPLNRLADRLETSMDERDFLEATPQYLRTLADSLSRDQQAMGELLGTLGGNLRHIHDVIRAQRQHARPSIAAEPFVVGDLVREAIDCCQARLESEQVSVRLGGALQETIRTDRAMLLQVFINIVGNATESLRMKPTGNRELHIEIQTGELTLQLTFQDNGIGMDSATLQRAFDAHFTTRRSGSGLGLHFCALAISRLGGGMRALSDGPGRGATFVIELPRVLPSESSTAARRPQTSSRHALEVEV